MDKRQAATPTATSTPGWFPTTPTATVAVATAREDGAIIHIVQPGETLWTIALAYGVTEADIQRFNNLGQYIYPGDKLFIRPAYTPTPTQPTPTQTARPSSTPWPTSTPTPTRTPLPATPIPAAGLSPVGGAAIVAIIVLAALGLAALAARAGRRPHRSG